MLCRTLLQPTHANPKAPITNDDGSGTEEAENSCWISINDPPFVNEYEVLT